MKSKLLLLSLIALSVGGGACSKANAATPAIPDEVLRQALAKTRDVAEVGILLGLNGSPTFLGCIGATTTAHNNSTTVGDGGTPVHTAFTIPADTKFLLVWTSAAVKILADTDATEDITITNGMPLKAEEKWVLVLKSAQSYVQAITDSSTANVCLWGLD